MWHLSCHPPPRKPWQLPRHDKHLAFGFSEPVGAQLHLSKGRERKSDCRALEFPWKQAALLRRLPLLEKLSLKALLYTTKAWAVRLSLAGDLHLFILLGPNTILSSWKETECEWKWECACVYFLFKEPSHPRAPSCPEHPVIPAKYILPLWSGP